MDNEYRVHFRGVDSLLSVTAYGKTSEEASYKATKILVVMVKNVDDWAFESCEFVPEAADFD